MINTAIIGCGKIAECHAVALASSPSSRLVAVCDVNEDRARNLAERYGAVSVYTDAEKMFRDQSVQMVSICTPSGTREKVVRLAASVKAHVLCEKPFSATLQQADSMIANCRQAGVKLGVIFQRRFWQSSQRLRKAIDEGKLNQPVLGECIVKYCRLPEFYQKFPAKARIRMEGGGVLANQAIHCIDLLQWYMGEPAEIFGYIDRYLHKGIEVEDSAVAVIKFKSGAMATIEASVVQNPGLFSRVTVHGDNGVSASIFEQPPETVGYHDIWTVPGEDKCVVESMVEARERERFPYYHVLQINDFLQAIIKDREPAVTGEEGRKSLEIVAAIYKSAQTGVPVNMPVVGFDEE